MGISSKSRAIAAAVVLGAAMLAKSAAAEAVVSLTASAYEDFTSGPSVGEAAGSFAIVPPFGGFGWEVVFKSIGVGGDYQAKFSQSATSAWWLDWYGSGIYASYHVFGGDAWLDPFVRAGAGSSGRVILRGDTAGEAGLGISLFPLLGAGIALRLDDIIRIGAIVNFAPYQGPVPVTDIAERRIGTFQVGLFAGYTF